ncbi:Methyltransferase domain-containing protein [Lentzea fradiae]|uniref:Methyltransferase domain-containing protein n=1 Tax=Lentzea fradiae TaxID=200378 RepID=A0A1G8D4K1_9PSEU|nr:class I SAM-dependent methyltransferase [Lentzea fradiae]SDH52622.1 Methyltransferase domain-containing protein [Lentzea fradiae]
MTGTSSQERDYIPGMGKHYLLPFYEVLHRVTALGRVHRDMVELAAPRRGDRVLDVGCGTGNLLRTTGKTGADLFGVDPDLKMLARAERKLRRAGIRARLDRGYAQELRFPDGSFDKVFSSLMLHHLDVASKDEMLAEVRRVLKPGGVFVLADTTRENAGERIAAAGFTVEPTRTRKLRVFREEIGIEVATAH